MFYFCGYIFASLDTAYCELKRAGRFRCLLANCENFQFLPFHFRCHIHIYFYYWLFLSLYAISIFLNVSHSKLIYPFFFFLTFIHCCIWLILKSFKTNPFSLKQFPYVILWCQVIYICFPWMLTAVSSFINVADSLYLDFHIFIST